jgi:hypothetical protein
MARHDHRAGPVDERDGDLAVGRQVLVGRLDLFGHNLRGEMRDREHRRRYACVCICGGFQWKPSIMYCAANLIRITLILLPVARYNNTFCRNTSTWGVEEGGAADSSPSSWASESARMAGDRVMIGYASCTRVPSQNRSFSARSLFSKNALASSDDAMTARAGRWRHKTYRYVVGLLLLNVPAIQ